MSIVTCSTHTSEMRKDLLSYYEENLKYFRELGAEFAQEYPKVAAQLRLNSNDYADPCVERLLEGAAFLAARTEKKFDDGVPYQIETILAPMAPLVLLPQPSYTIMELEPTMAALTPDTCIFPHSTLMETEVPGIQTPCRFTTLWDIPLYNITLTDAEYLTLDMEKYGLHSPAGLMLEFDVATQTYSRDADHLILYLNMLHSLSSELQRQMQTELSGVYVMDESEPMMSCDGITCDIPSFDKDRSQMLQNIIRLNGFAHLYRFSVFRNGYSFLRIHSFASLLKKSVKGRLRLIFAFRREEPTLVHQIQRDNIKMNCVPAANLFFKRSTRVPLELEHETHLIPSRTAPLDFEIYSVLQIELNDQNNQNSMVLHNIYNASETADMDSDSRLVFSSRRVERPFNPARQRSSYAGSELFCAFSGDVLRRLAPSDNQMTADLICSNRDIPLLLRSNAVFSVFNNSIVKSAVMLVPPTAPRMPLISGNNLETWEKVSFLTMKLSSLLWQNGIMPAKILRELIRHFSIEKKEDLEKKLAGIVELRTEPHIFRMIQKGSVFFENGWDVTLLLNEPDFAGTGFYVFGYMVRTAISMYLPINSMVRFTLSTVQEGKIAEWMI